jgi:hypothetical protein
MSTPSISVTCRRCGLRVRYVPAELVGPNHIETAGNFGELCQAVPKRADPSLCPELRSAIDRIQRFSEIGYLG